MPTLLHRKPYLNSSVLVEIWHASSLRPSLGLFFGKFWKFYFIDLVSDFLNTGLRRYDCQHWPSTPGLWPSTLTATLTIDIYHWHLPPSTLTIDIDHRLWPSTLTIYIDHRFCRIYSDHQHWPSTLTINIDHRHWPSILTINTDHWH